MNCIKYIHGDTENTVRLEEIGFRVGQKIDVIKKNLVRINGIKYWFRLDNVFIVLDDDSVLGE
jgi:Fe2+ transport system protein FeoA